MERTQQDTDNAPLRIAQWLSESIANRSSWSIESVRTFQVQEGAVLPVLQDLQKVLKAEAGESASLQTISTALYIVAAWGAIARQGGGYVICKTPSKAKVHDTLLEQVLDLIADATLRVRRGESVHLKLNLTGTAIGDISPISSAAGPRRLWDEMRKLLQAIKEQRTKNNAAAHSDVQLVLLDPSDSTSVIYRVALRPDSSILETDKSIAHGDWQLSHTANGLFHGFMAEFERAIQSMTLALAQARKLSVDFPDIFEARTSHVGMSFPYAIITNMGVVLGFYARQQGAATTPCLEADRHSTFYELASNDFTSIWRVALPFSHIHRFVGQNENAQSRRMELFDSYPVSMRRYDCIDRMIPATLTFNDGPIPFDTQSSKLLLAVANQLLESSRMSRYLDTELETAPGPEDEGKQGRTQEEAPVSG